MKEISFGELEELGERAYNIVRDGDWSLPCQEATCMCESCGALLDAEYRSLEDDAVIVFEPRSDLGVLLIHKPDPINGLPACGGRMNILTGPRLFGFRSITQDETLDYVEDKPALHVLLDLVDSGKLPRNYIRFFRLRSQGKSVKEIANMTQCSTQAIYKAFRQGDKTLEGCDECVKQLLSDQAEDI